jgi:hypothetical protein
MKLKPKQVRSLLARKGLPRLIRSKVNLGMRDVGIQARYLGRLGKGLVSKEGLTRRLAGREIRRGYDKLLSYTTPEIRTAAKHAERIVGQAAYQGKLKAKYAAEYTYARAKADPVGAAAVGGGIVGGVAGYSNYGMEPQNRKRGFKRAAYTVGGAVTGAWLAGAGMHMKQRGRGSLR